MLIRLKRMVAVIAVVTTVITQTPIAGAFTISNSTGTTGNNTSTPASTGGNNTASQLSCAFFVSGCNGSSGTAVGNNNTVLPGSSTGNNTVLPGSSVGNNTALPGYVSGNNTVNPGSCAYYVSGCPTGSTTPGSNNTILPGNPCDYTINCQTSYPGAYPSQPGMSLCNNHSYPYDINGHWAQLYIRHLYDLCIISGYTDNSFRPEQNITRAELTKMALYSAGIAPNSGCYDADCGSPFNDLDFWQGAWIRPAWDRHIVQGRSSSIFAPNRPITRAEATKIILSAFGYGPISTGKSFFNDVYGWSTGWIEQAHRMAIIQGIGNGNFDPNRTITRAEAAKIIALTLQKRGR